MILEHDVAGAGPAVLLLHSGVGDRRQWDPQWPELVRSRRAVRPDLRGFGDSPLEPGAYSDVEDVLGLLDHLGIERADVVGSSYGGRVALHLAAAAPERVRRLVLLCPAYGGLDPTADAEAFGQEEDRLLEAGDVEGAVDLNVRTWLGPEADAATADLVAAMQRRAFEVQLAADEWADPPRTGWPALDLAEVSAPTTVISGALDLAFFAEIAALLATTLPEVDHRVWPDTAHLPNLEHPGRTTRLLLDALA